MINSSVVLIAFKRPKETKKIYKIVSKVKPKKIYIFQDGYDNSFSKNEEKKYFETKKFITNLKSKKVKKFFFKKNIGLRYIAFNILKIVFRNENKIIIIEDDTMPKISFFKYCDIMLKKYSFNKKIAQISGCNLFHGINKKQITNDSYIFSKYPQIWGWATWRDRWQKYYDPDIKSWPKKRNSFLRKKNLRNGEKRYLKFVLDKTYSKIGQGWDQQWIYACIQNDLKTIVPSKNLIKNIGFKSDPTGKGARKFRNLFFENIKFPIKHPQIISNSEIYDRFLYLNFYNRKFILKRMINKVKLYFKYSV